MPHRTCWRRPFIYTPADIDAVLEQGRQVIVAPLRAATYDTLIGLLAASGLRIGEAITLDRSDVDWVQGVLLIRESKFGKSRLVPLHPSSVRALDAYAQLRDELQPRPKDASFFVSLKHKRLLYAVVRQTFRRLIDAAGIGAGAPSPPRLHDLRHTFAVRTLDMVTDPAYRGRGLASSAYTLIFDALLESGRAERIVGKVPVDNGANRRALMKSGWREFARVEVRRVGPWWRARVDVVPASEGRAADAEELTRWLRAALERRPAVA